jgi:hypothetical protein
MFCYVFSPSSLLYLSVPPPHTPDLSLSSSAANIHFYVKKSDECISSCKWPNVFSTVSKFFFEASTGAEIAYLNFIAKGKSPSVLHRSARRDRDYNMGEYVSSDG